MQQQTRHDMHQLLPDLHRDVEQGVAQILNDHPELLNLPTGVVDSLSKRVANQVHGYVAVRLRDLEIVG